MGRKLVSIDFYEQQGVKCTTWELEKELQFWRWLQHLRRHLERYHIWMSVLIPQITECICICHYSKLCFLHLNNYLEYSIHYHRLEDKTCSYYNYLRCDWFGKLEWHVHLDLKPQILCLEFDYRELSTGSCQSYSLYAYSTKLYWEDGKPGIE